MAAPRRQYGLILPKKTQQLQKPVLQKPSVFDDDSDEETSVRDSLQREAFKKQVMKQTKLEIQKALAEDATVYEYDSIYDEMQRKKEESNPKLLLVKDRQPKYIHSLLKAVEIRKKEQEKRMEKKIQREREMEKGEFDDKEAFVTSAYKKKLQERAEEAERERRAAALEARLDVTKQKDLSGFYRHLLNQTVGEEEVPECSLRETSSRIKEEKPRGYSDELNPDNGVPDDGDVPKARVKEEENPDADSDIDVDSSEEDDKMADKSHSNCKSGRSHAHSSSSGEDRGQYDKGHTRGSKAGGSDPAVRDRGDQHQDRGHESQVREQNKCPIDGGRQKEKTFQHRPREDSSKEYSRRRHEPEERERGKERRERRRTDSRERRREEEWEKQPPRDRERARRRNSEDQRDEEREAREGGRGRAERKKHQHEKSRDKELSTGPSEREGPSSGSGVQDRPRGEEGSSEGGNTERASSPKGTQGPKHQQEGGGEGGEKPPETQSKFAKRSSKETVTSARDRYLARQMARCGAKTYIEKEED
ncbi:nuclear speckle splicing regulatory protein 1 [Vombatus ursinus]|uniref:Nuclear speckle splicing regulatory protein 1 n=1 Tax=Vombatus ursinus TaxID=29139 RepID=A0A4X2KQ05_VOMUR|nr:nuclear speckle splicing regulatory protein 1 [Vombatus ursinus]